MPTWTYIQRRLLFSIFGIFRTVSCLPKSTKHAALHIMIFFPQKIHIHWTIISKPNMSKQWKQSLGPSFIQSHCTVQIRPPPESNKQVLNQLLFSPLNVCAVLGNHFPFESQPSGLLSIFKDNFGLDGFGNKNPRESLKRLFPTWTLTYSSK